MEAKSHDPNLFQTAGHILLGRPLMFRNSHDLQCVSVESAVTSRETGETRISQPHPQIWMMCNDLTT